MHRTAIFGNAEPRSDEQVFVIDRLVRLRDYDGAGKQIRLPIPDGLELPGTIKLPPQPPHWVFNEDTTGFLGTRIEF